MRASEILRKLADVIDAAENEKTGLSSPDRQFNKTTLEPVEVDNSEGNDPNAITMIPPLQQKIEILKKSVGIDNEFDHGFDGHNDDGQEIHQIRKNAGLSAAQIESIDDDITG